MKSLAPFLLALLLLLPSFAFADVDSDDPMPPGQQTCQNNNQCTFGTCTTVNFSDQTAKVCLDCRISDVACSDGKSCNQSTGYCVAPDEEPVDEDPDSCDTHAECAAAHGGDESYRCVLDPETDQKRCMVAISDDDFADEEDDAGAGGAAGGGNQLVNVLPGGIQRIDQLAVLILDAIVYLGTVLLILMLVWSGFLFIRAQGSSEELTKAKQSLFWTIVGGLVLLGASGLSLLLQATIQSL